MPFTFGSLLTTMARSRSTWARDALPAIRSRRNSSAAPASPRSKLQDLLIHIGANGFRHHVGLTPGKVATQVAEALDKYLGSKVALPQA